MELAFLFDSPMNSGTHALCMASLILFAKTTLDFSGFKRRVGQFYVFQNSIL